MICPGFRLQAFKLTMNVLRSEHVAFQYSRDPRCMHARPGENNAASSCGKDESVEQFSSRREFSHHPSLALLEYPCLSCSWSLRKLYIRSSTLRASSESSPTRFWKHDSIPNRRGPGRIQDVGDHGGNTRAFAM
jgi:hypothetical protein